MARTVIHDLAGQASLAEETSSWSYRHDRDLTGFIGGSENPTLLDAPSEALLPEGVPGAAGSVLLLQKWKHKVAEWEALPIDQQERIMGRTKLDSIELENKPSDSHVARTDQDEFGKIFRRNMPLRENRRPWHRVRWIQRRPEAAFQNARQHGGPDNRYARCAHTLYPAADRLLLFRAFRRESAALTVKRPRTYGYTQEKQNRRNVPKDEALRIAPNRPEVLSHLAEVGLHSLITN